ncbi:proteasome assembly chaperone 2 [Aricia agestis]|uniref:proteasome assembly chaperone 2 n=1 Tax=Aricia agestis TaxID=91739 RepID=UPI001C206BF3|nr:proteasome assembly chaperone 2 [Aricia agestis]
MSDKLEWKYNGEHSLKGYTVIIPSVAVGNVGQLACDLLISSLRMKKIASLYTPALIPVLGQDPYDQKSNNLCGSCDMYKSEKELIIVVQIRAPLMCKYARKFLESLANHFQKIQIRDIVILTSSFAHEKKNIMSSPFRFLGTSVYEKNLRSINIPEHESVDDELRIYGGGFACLFYKICKEKSLPCIVLYKYCSEGDNIPDAYEMVYFLNSLNAIFSEKDVNAQLIQPVSWKLLFGRPPPIDIY